MGSKLHISVFGERLKARRKQLKMTQRELSKETNITLKTINTWENGNIKSGPRSEHIIALCDALDCSFEYLFGGLTFPTPKHAQIESDIGLSIEAIDALRRYRKLSDRNNNRDENQLISYQIGSQYLDFFSSFISSYKIMGAIDYCGGKINRLSCSGLTENEAIVFDDEQRAIEYYSFELAKEIQEFVLSFFEEY